MADALAEATGQSFLHFGAIQVIGRVLRIDLRIASQLPRVANDREAQGGPRRMGIAPV